MPLLAAAALRRLLLRLFLLLLLSSSWLSAAAAAAKPRSQVLDESVEEKSATERNAIGMVVIRGNCIIQFECLDRI